MNTLFEATMEQVIENETFKNAIKNIITKWNDIKETELVVGGNFLGAWDYMKKLNVPYELGNHNNGFVAEMIWITVYQDVVNMEVEIDLKTGLIAKIVK